MAEAPKPASAPAALSRGPWCSGEQECCHQAHQKHGNGDAPSNHEASVGSLGAGNLFRTFSRDISTAKAKINRMSSDEVYRYILKHHPREETRNYLRKVTEKKQRYASMG